MNSLYVKGKNLYRYTYNDGELGGIVFADNKKAAMKKLKERYCECDDRYLLKKFEIWNVTEDPYYCEDGMCEIYG